MPHLYASWIYGAKYSSINRQGKINIIQCLPFFWVSPIRLLIGSLLTHGLRIPIKQLLQTP